MLEVGLDLRPAADAPHGGHQPKGLIWLDHDSSLRPAKPVRHPALFPCSTWPSRILSVSRAAPLLPSPHRHRDTGAHRAGPGSRGRGRSHTGRQGSHMSILGTRVMRTEDPRLLTFGGTYVDDLRVPELAGASRITFVRSPLAHALISGIDGSAARSAPGVVAALTAADLNDLPPPPPDDGSGGNEAAPLPLGGPWAEPLLAVDRVRYVGEPVAIVITDDRYQGADAAELVSVDYEPLPAVVGADAALAGGTLLFPAAGSNVPVTGGAPADGSAFDGCDVVLQRTIVNQRLAPVPLEGRAAAAKWADGKLTVWVSTQNAQISRFVLAGVVGLDPGAIRVVAPDVGGGFGAKVGIDRDAQREPCGDDARASPAAGDQDRRSQGRAHPGLPARDRAGRGCLPADGRLPSLPHPPDGGRPVRHPPRRGRLQRGGDQHDSDRRVPRGRAARGDGRDRAGRGPVRRRDRQGPGRSPPDQPGAAGGVPVQLPLRARL